MCQSWCCKTDYSCSIATRYGIALYLWCCKTASFQSCGGANPAEDYDILDGPFGTDPRKCYYYADAKRDRPIVMVLQIDTSMI
jgi:hypothetical protein